MKKHMITLLLCLSLLFLPSAAVRAAGDFVPDEESINDADRPSLLTSLDGEHCEEEDGIPLAGPIPGDANSDGCLNLRDVSLLFQNLRSASGSIPAEAADYNGDGEANLMDVYAVFRHYTERGNGIKVFVSPSNQNANTYSYGNTNEAVQCNLIGFQVQRSLVRCGFDTKLADYDDYMILRADISNEWGADLHLPIHTNAYNKSSGGTQVYYNPTDGDAPKIAPYLFNELKDLTPGSSSREA